MRGLTALLLLAGSLTAVLGAGRTWLTVQAQDPVLGRTEALVTGASVTGAVTAMGLLGAAAALVSVLTRGTARRSGLVLALAAGVWLVWIGVRVVLDPVAAARSADLTGAGGSPGSAPILGSVPGAGAVTAAELSAWPVIVALAGLLVVTGVVTGLLPDRRAPGRPTRAATAGRAGHPGETIAPSAPAESQEQERRQAAKVWDELSAGHDPTDDAPPGPVAKPDPAAKSDLHLPPDPDMPADGSGPHGARPSEA